MERSQSTEPPRLTSTADRQSESRPYSPIGTVFISVPFPVTGKSATPPQVSEVLTGRPRAGKDGRAPCLARPGKASLMASIIKPGQDGEISVRFHHFAALSTGHCEPSA